MSPGSLRSSEIRRPFACHLVEACEQTIREDYDHGRIDSGRSRQTTHGVAAKGASSDSVPTFRKPQFADEAHPQNRSPPGTMLESGVHL